MRTSVAQGFGVTVGCCVMRCWVAGSRPTGRKPQGSERLQHDAKTATEVERRQPLRCSIHSLMDVVCHRRISCFIRTDEVLHEIERQCESEREDRQRPPEDRFWKKTA